MQELIINPDDNAMHKDQLQPPNAEANKKLWSVKTAMALVMLILSYEIWYMYRI